MANTALERRLHPRYTAPYRVVVSADEARRLSMLTDDVSGGGLFLATPHDLPVDQPLDLTVHLPDGQRAVRCTGRVVRRASKGPEERAGYGVKLDFEDPSDAISYVSRINALREGAVDTSPEVFTVLLVDENQLVREVVSETLPRHWRGRYAQGPQLEVDVAADLREAMQRLKQRSYRLIVTELNLASRGGHALTQAIRSDAATAATPILAVSAEDVTAELKRFDVDAFLRKPLRLKELYPLVHTLLAGRTGELLGAGAEGSASPLAQAIRVATETDPD